jgi:hypothetical protein
MHIMPTNNPIGHEGYGTEPLSVQALKHEGLEAVIGQLHSQLRVLKLERAAILKRIGMVKKIVVGLADLFGSDVINGELQELLSLESVRRLRTHFGITDLCRQVLREVSAPLTLRQMLGQLQEKSPVAWAGQRHPENVLRVILQRLVAYGEAEELHTEEGLRTWRSTASSRQARNEES